MGLLRTTVLTGNPQGLVVAEGFVQMTGDGVAVNEPIAGIPTTATVELSYNSAGGFTAGNAGHLSSEVTAVGNLRIGSDNVADDNRVNFRATWQG